VSVRTDLTVTGRPAQFGRGVMAEVGDRLVGQFAQCLADRLAEPAEPTAQAEEPPAEEPLDLLRSAAVPVARRAGRRWRTARLAVALLVACVRRWRCGRADDRRRCRRRR
jgi:hypothetical protein